MKAWVSDWGLVVLFALAVVFNLGMTVQIEREKYQQWQQNCQAAYDQGFADGKAAAYKR